MNGDVSPKAPNVAISHADSSKYGDETSRSLTEMDVKPTIVTFKLDGAPMAIIRVESGTSFVWRVRLPDMRLCSGGFANAARAMRWIAVGRPLRRSQDELDCFVGRNTIEETSRQSRADAVELGGGKVEPKWVVVEWRRRSDPTWLAGLPSVLKRSKLD
jgi:hypothetical protein